MILQESGEMYLESIYVLSKTKSMVRAIDVGEHMGYSKPSVSRAVGILKNNDYITVDMDGSIKLTDKGLEVATTIYERHVILTAILTKIGVDAEIAAKDACKIEHIISPESFDALKAHFGY